MKQRWNKVQAWYLHVVKFLTTLPSPISLLTFKYLHCHYFWYEKLKKPYQVNETKTFVIKYTLKEHFSLALYFSTFSLMVRIFLLKPLHLQLYRWKHYEVFFRYTNIVINTLRLNFAIISEWFYENYIVINADKCHFLTVGFNKPFPDFSFNDTKIENVTGKKILRAVIDKMNLALSLF